MAYITIADLEARYGAGEIVKLADRDNDSVADADVVAAAIEDACEVIDSYLSSSYQTPLNPVPGLVIRLACAIARYHLYDDKPTEHVSVDYQTALGILSKVASGEIQFPLLPPGEAGSPGYSQGDPKFGGAGDY